MLLPNTGSRLFVIFAGCFLLASCTTDALVSCSEISKLLTTYGLLNTEGEVLGNLIDLDPASKHGAFLGALKDFDPTKDASVHPDSDTTDISSGSGLTISFSATLTQAESASLTSALSQNIQLHLQNTNRHQIDQPQTVVNRPDNRSLITQLLRTGHHLVLVDAGNTAEKTTFQLKNNADNELKVGVAGKSFDLKVNYQCQGALDTEISKDRAAGALTFFKIVEITANADGSLAVSVFAGSITDYDLSQAII